MHTIEVPSRGLIFQFTLPGVKRLGHLQSLNRFMNLESGRQPPEDTARCCCSVWNPRESRRSAHETERRSTLPQAKSTAVSREKRVQWDPPASRRAAGARARGGAKEAGHAGGPRAAHGPTGNLQKESDSSNPRCDRPRGFRGRGAGVRPAG